MGTGGSNPVAPTTGPWSRAVASAEPKLHGVTPAETLVDASVCVPRASWRPGPGPGPGPGDPRLPGP